MRKLVLVLIVLLVLGLACTLPRKAPAPATQVPVLPTSAPTLPPPTDVPNTPTALPTQPPPTETPLPTSTPMPTAVPPTATQAPTATPEATEYATLLFEDDFSTDKGVWPQDGDVSDGIAVTNLIDGELVTHVIASMYDVFIPLDFAVDGPVLIQVDVNLLEGDASAAYGIMCNYKDGDNYYGMTAAENGYIELYRWENGERETLSEKTGSTLVKRGINVLKAICDQDMIGFFVNDELVDNYLSLSGLSGDVGLLAGTLDVADVYVGFDNFSLTRLNYEAPTALPTESVVATAEPELPAGVLFVDEFETDNGLWWIGDDNISTEEISGGQLAATIHETYYDIDIPLEQSFGGSVQIDVDGLSLVGHKNTGYGVICGHTENDDYYGMTITELGHASIFRWKKGVRTPLWDLYDVAAIKRGGNHITGVCDGKVLEFYVNGQMLKSITNYNPIEGRVGLAVTSFGSDEVTIGFDNFVVTSLE